MINATTTQTAQAENSLQPEVLRIVPVGGTGQLKANARIRIGPVVIDRVRILQADDGNLWASIPQIPARKNGTGWISIIEFVDHRVWIKVREAVIAAYREYIGAGGAA
jgi:hypothetical protein